MFIHLSTTKPMNTRQFLFNLWLPAILLCTGLLLLAGCQSDEEPIPAPETGSVHTLKITALMPSEGDAGTRVAASQKADSKNIVLRWKEGDKIQPYFTQGGNIQKGTEVSVKNISEDGKRAEFDLSIPEGIDTANPWKL